jgi:hypothetical protein
MATRGALISRTPVSTTYASAVTGYMMRANTMHDETRSDNHAQDPGARPPNWNASKRRGHC